jgi:hypothetical protein
MRRFDRLITGFSLLTILGMGSCGPVANTGYLYQTAAAAHDHIMLVKESPPTFGFQRLQALSQHYPDLMEFIEQKGQPRYYAETTNAGNRYFILYYPKRLEAFACRSESVSSRKIEFSGPYPITRNELDTLADLENDVESTPKR